MVVVRRSKKSLVEDEGFQGPDKFDCLDLILFKLMFLNANANFLLIFINSSLSL